MLPKITWGFDPLTQLARRSLQTQSCLGSPSTQVFLIIKHINGSWCKSTSKTDKKLPMMFWHAQELWKHCPVTSRSVEARQTVKLGKILFKRICSRLFNKNKLLEVLNLLSASHWDRRLVSNTQLQLGKERYAREAEQSLEVFAPNVAIVDSGINPTIP